MVNDVSIAGSLDRLTANLMLGPRHRVHRSICRRCHGQNYSFMTPQDLTPLEYSSQPASTHIGLQQ